jgi:hypothetical protein
MFGSAGFCLSEGLFDGDAATKRPVGKALI